MKRVLGKKQSSKHEDWIGAMENIETLISREEIERKTLETIAQIREITAGKTVAYAWSGGKDSLVLGRICEAAGIPDCMMGVCEMEYPKFMDWVDYNRPEYLQIINTGQDLEWLAKHPEMLFPKDSKTASRWFQIVQHKAHSEDIYGTVTHNRARGTHLLEPMKKIVKELMNEGKTIEEIGKQLGMKPEEIFRLSDFTKEDFLKMMTKDVKGYSKAEFITKI